MMIAAGRPVSQENCGLIGKILAVAWHHAQLPQEARPLENMQKTKDITTQVAAKCQRPVKDIRTSAKLGTRLRRIRCTATKRPFAYRNNWPGSLWRSERSANNPDTKAIDSVSAIVTDNNHTGKTV